MIPIVVAMLGKVSKGLEKRLEELEIRRSKTIQTTALLRQTQESWRPNLIWFCSLMEYQLL